MTIEQPRDYAPLIDILRFGAALLVLLHHLAGTWPHGLQQSDLFAGYPDVSDFTPLTYAGFVGVEIFFVISGYVISQSAVGRTAKAFFIGRAVRIVPVLWICTFVSIVLHLSLGASFTETLAGAIRSAVLFPSGGWLDGVVWTLTVEAAFYGLIFICILCSGGRSRSFLPITAWALAIISTSYNAVLFLQSATNGSYVPNILLLAHGALFALGMAIWGFFQKMPAMRRSLPLALLGSVLEIANQVASYSHEGGDRSIAIPVAIFLVATGLVFLGAKRARQARHEWARQIGLTTYPLYLLHFIVGGTVVMLAHEQGASTVSALAFGAIAAMVASWLIATRVEPFLRPLATRLFTWIADTLDLSRLSGRSAGKVG